MAQPRVCSYINCLKDIDRAGVIVRLNSSPDTEIGFCCLAHAEAAIRKTRVERGEARADTPEGGF